MRVPAFSPRGCGLTSDGVMYMMVIGSLMHVRFCWGDLVRMSQRESQR
jgi:hypothetical protein